MAQIIGLHPDNLISPIDFVPGVGPLVKIGKAIRLFKNARKTRKKGGVINYINSFGDDALAFGNLISAGALARLTTVPLVKPAYDNRSAIMAFTPGMASAGRKHEFFVDEFA